MKKKKKVKEDAISILRGISIRMPLMIYGAKVENEDEELTIDNFTQLVDPQSWEEFMPRGVTKQKFNQFKKYYDPDIFTAAAKRIRQMARAADNLTVEERIERIAGIFSTFRNPDKETVLTPWRVVNMHMSDTLGGYTFFNDDFSETIEEPRFVDRGEVTADVFAPDSHLLEINSKSGLYPLYLAYNIYRSRLRNAMFSPETLEEHQAIWDAAVAENIFVICKTPMAKAITRRTLLGFRKGKANMWAPEDLINKIKNQPDLFIKKVSDLVGKNVKIKAIVGNPPYQIMDGGAGVSAMPVYNIFLDMAKRLSPEYISMIMPSRWFAGGKGLDGFRENMLNDTHVSAIYDFINAKDCFPNASISGGVNYLLWDKNHNGSCFITTILGDKKDTELRPLNEFDVFIRYNAAVHIVKKCKALNTFSSLVYARNPFGLSSNIRGNRSGEIHLISSQGSSYLPAETVPYNHPLLNKYKILMSKVTAEHAGEPDKSGKFKIISRTEVIGPKDVCTDSYLIIGASENKEIVQNEYKYISTRFARFLLMLAVSSINLSSDKFQFVPIQDFSKNSDIDWSKSVEEIDAQLYAKYHLSDEEIAFIESMIKSM